MTWLNDLVINGRTRWSTQKDQRVRPDPPTTKTIADLDDFQARIAESILHHIPKVFTVDERSVWAHYHKPSDDGRRNQVPMQKMQEIAEVLECSFSIAVWSYVYKFWWGGWEYHPYTPYQVGTHRPQELCGLRTPLGFQCHLPKEAHAELQSQ